MRGRGTGSNLVAGACGLAALAGLAIAPRMHLANPRLAYALGHLPAALAWLAVFVLAAGWAAGWAGRRPGGLAEFESRPAIVWLAGIVVLFCVYWLPVVLAGGFAQDDWVLLASASMRPVIVQHPALAWVTLDAVDGNFRPLGTVLLPALLLKVVGLRPLFYLAANFAASLAGALVVFLLVRALGYAKSAAAVSASLYLSRDVLYTQNAWFCALGDGLAILFCGLAALATLRALGSRPWSAAGLHLCAAAAFGVALGAKQSAFAGAVILPLVCVVRPGRCAPRPLGQRLAAGGLALAVYGGMTLLVFRHARELLGNRTPYPLALGVPTLLAAFSYLSAFFTPFTIQKGGALVRALPAVVGAGLLVGLIAMARRLGRLARRRRRDLLFLLLAAAASLAVVLPLAPRVALYYSSMFAFWFSMALGICLVHAGGTSRGARMLFVALLVTGFAGVRLKQTGLIPSGGYLWGTYGMDQARAQFARLDEVMARAPAVRTLVLVEPARGNESRGNEPRRSAPNPRSLVAMAFLAGPQLTRVVVYDEAAGRLLGNDRQGRRAAEDEPALRDPGAYDWVTSLPETDWAQLAAGTATLWLEARNDGITLRPSRCAGLRSPETATPAAGP